MGGLRRRSRRPREKKKGDLVREHPKGTRTGLFRGRLRGRGGGGGERGRKRNRRHCLLKVSRSQKRNALLTYPAKKKVSNGEVERVQKAEEV